MEDGTIEKTIVIKSQKNVLAATTAKTLTTLLLDQMHQMTKQQ